MTITSTVFNVVWKTLFGVVVGYGAFLTLLTIPFFQDHAIYLHGITLTWFQDTNVPEQWGFMKNQVTPFMLRTPDGEKLHAWHILPIELYARHEKELCQESTGLVNDITSRTGFRLLRDDPEALVVIYLHGAAGTLGSGYRPPSYRAVYAGMPSKIHIIAIDYRGYGQSSGKPSEGGLLTDALTLVDWVMNVAGIPADRIAIFAQSIGTAVGISLSHHLAMQEPPILFSGMVLVAPFADVKTLTATYRLAGTIPLLSPVAAFPRFLDALNKLIISKWPSKDRIAAFIRQCESFKLDKRNYHITIIHAEDDYDIPWTHSETLFWHAVNASTSDGIGFEELETIKAQTRNDLGAGGWTVDWPTKNGLIREQILKHGLHDRTMSYPVVSLAVLRAFGIDVSNSDRNS